MSPLNRESKGLIRCSDSLRLAQYFLGGLLALPLPSMAADGLDLSLGGVAQDLTVKTSRRLNYGILARQTFDSPSMMNLLKDTQMVEPQAAFFDLTKLSFNEWKLDATLDSITTASSSFPLASLDYIGPLQKEYVLYTEFDRLSKPAIYNYATATGMVLSISSGSAIGQKLNTAVKGVVKEVGEVGKASKKAVQMAAQTVEVARITIDGFQTLLDFAAEAGVEIPQEYTDIASLLRQSVARVDESVKKVAIGIDVVDGILGKAGKMATDPQGRPLTDYTGFQGGAASSRSLLLNVVGIFKIKGAQERIAKITNNAVLRQTLFEVMLEAMLEPFSNDGKFYYPKEGSQLSTMAAVFANPAAFDSVETTALARTLVRRMEGHKLGENTNATNTDVAAKRQAQMAALAVFSTAGREQLDRLKKFVKDIDSLDDAMGLVQSLSSGLTHLDSSQVIKYANTLVETAASQMEDVLADALEKLALRLASYAIPGAGWGRLAADAANAGNTAGAFAYDMFTAPRQIPFVLVGHPGTDAEVYKPFAVNLNKLSFFRYPQGCSLPVDPTSIGCHTYDSYFLDGNITAADFKGWNVNNRNVSLVANGAAFSYDVILGSASASAFDVMKANAGNFDKGIYSIDFAVKKYPQDDLAKTPGVFVSQVNGVSNQENAVRDEGFIDGSWLPFLRDWSFNLCKYQSGVSNCAERGADPVLSSTFSALGISEYHYLSFKQLFQQALLEKYGSAFSANYQADKGIVHVTPGAYTIEVGIGVRSPTGTRTSKDRSVTAEGETRFEDKQTTFVLASVSNGDANSNLVRAKGSFTPSIIPYLTAVGMERSASNGAFFITFKLLESNRFNRPLRLALANKETAEWAGATQFWFHTLDPAVRPDDKSVYRIPIPADYVELIGNVWQIKASARLIWYDALLDSYVKYINGNEELLVKRLLTRNASACSTGDCIDAVTKVIMAQASQAGSWLLTEVGVPANLSKPDAYLELAVGNAAATAFDEQSDSFSAKAGEVITLHERNTPAIADFSQLQGSIWVVLRQDSGGPCPSLAWMNYGVGYCAVAGTLTADGGIRVVMPQFDGGFGRFVIASISDRRPDGTAGTSIPKWSDVRVVEIAAPAPPNDDSGAKSPAPLNDTGIVGFASDGLNSMNTEPTTHPRQDARYGQDAQAGAGKLTRIGGGGKGFDFSKIANDGSVLTEAATLGGGAKDWACTRDNTTGLLWEVKTNSGLRGMNHTYSWYSTVMASNGGWEGAETGGSCFQNGRCDTEKFVQDVNASRLCGKADWRLPKMLELAGIADFGRSSPAIDPSYFPNTASASYWSGTPYAGGSYYAWSVYFYGLTGGVIPFSAKSDALSLRLVHTGP